VLYYLTGLAGYLSFLNNTPELIVDRPSLDGGHSDVLMLIGRVGTIILMCTSITIMGSPCRA